MEKVKDRLLKYLAFKNISQGKFEKDNELANGYVNNIRKSISQEKIDQIKKNGKYADLNFSWLLLGEGEMLQTMNKVEPARFIGDAEREKYYLGKHNTFREINDEGDYMIIAPFISVKARAGYLAGWGDEDYLKTLPKVEFAVDELHKGEYLVIEASGDSMDNGLRESIGDGDKMLCRKIKRDLWAEAKLHLHDYNPDFVIHHVEDGLVVKRIIEHNVEEGYLVCHSLNPDKKTYPDYKIYTKDISQIFSVVQTQQNRKRK